MSVLKEGTYILYGQEPRKLIVELDLNKEHSLFVAYFEVGGGIESMGLVRDDVIILSKEENPEYFL